MFECQGCYHGPWERVQCDDCQSLDVPSWSVASCLIQRFQLVLMLLRHWLHLGQRVKSIALSDDSSPPMASEPAQLIRKSLTFTQRGRAGRLAALVQMPSLVTFSGDAGTTLVVQPFFSAAGVVVTEKCPLPCGKGHGLLELEAQLLWRATEMLPHMLPAAKAPPGIGMHVNRFDALAGRAAGSAILRDHMGNSLLNCKGVHSSGERPTDRQLLTKPSRCWLNGARSRVMRFRMPASGVMRVNTFCDQTSRVHP